MKEVHSEDNKRPKVIFTCFAGRRRNMELLLQYTDRLHSMGLLDEMHIWDFSRDGDDELWLSRTFQTAPIIKTNRYEYAATPVKVDPGEPARIKFKASRDAHILLMGQDGKTVAEISLGAYNNSCSFLRAEQQGKNIAIKGGPICDGTAWRAVEVVTNEDGYTTVSMDGHKIMEGNTGKKAAFPVRIKVAGWGNSEEIQWIFEDNSENGRAHSYARLFRVRNKGSWGEYYKHYTTQLYPDHIVIKSDDDIVFIDTDSFSRFIDSRVRDQESILLFPSIVNNGMCAFLQQSRGYFNNSIGVLPHEGVMGRLWGDGKLCGLVHQQFVEGHEEWLARAKGSEDNFKVPIGDRVSINFFAIKSEDLYVYQMLGGDDERDITVEITRKLGRNHTINMNMTVSHLAFFKQRDTGLDEPKALQMYRRLARIFLGGKPIKTL